MAWDWKKIREGGWQEFRGQIVSAGISVLSPWISAAVVFVTGIMQIPVAYAITAAGVMFAAVSFGAYYFYNLFFQRSPEAKLIPISPQVNVMAPERDGERRIETLSIGMNLQNSATFPIEYRVVDLDFYVDDRVNPNSNLANLHATVYPNTIGAFWPDGVDIHDFGLPREFNCKLHATIEYGRPNGRKFEMKKGFRVSAIIHPLGHTPAPGDVNPVQWFHAD
jgi:hypothetical protein